MSTTDIIILALLAIGAYRGFTKGFILEMVGILALLLGIFGAIFLLQEGMVYMEEQFEIANNILPYVTFLVLFVLIILGVNLLGRIVKKILDLTLLGTLDNLAGALVGAFKWALAISFIIWASTAFGIYFFDEEKEGSQLYSYIADLAPWVVEKVKSFAPGFDEVPTYST